MENKEFKKITTKKLNRFRINMALMSIEDEKIKEKDKKYAVVWRGISWSL